MRSAWIGLFAALVAGCGEHQGPGAIEGAALPDAVIEERERAQLRAAVEVSGGAPPARQILFGDLHVHTTFSADAFLMALPILQGEGAHPVADACDFARYCSGVDFWSINDHAEGLTPQRWQETIESIRQCNAVAGDPEDPDVVALLGWEWTQIGETPRDHYGHKNVILRDLEPERVPARPIHSDSFSARAMRQRPPLLEMAAIPLLDWPGRQVYFDFARFQRELRATPPCEADIDTRELPADCLEGAATPELLFRKLDEWGFESLVIPHGTTWGIYTPAGSSWDKQLTPRMHDPERQTLIEVFSGHGNSEEYRDWRAVEFDARGIARCPAPRDGYEPCCWRAGELVRGECDDPESAVCEARVAEARNNFVAAGVQGRLTVAASIEEWGDCGSCPDCFLPSQGYRPASSVQYILSLANLEDEADPLRFRFGFIASSDNHSARPGTGYKEYGRLTQTEARGARDEAWHRRTAAFPERPETLRSEPYDPANFEPWQVLDFERQASFFLTGGLAAVHAQGRSRQALWSALKRGEVYGTSGPRILLWFDLLNAPGGPRPMGSRVAIDADPRFRVRAVGSFEQLPGCPDVSQAGLVPERLERLCRGECYHPGEVRRRIERIEVVRIHTRVLPGEEPAALIEDPWRTLPGPPGPEGCTVEFSDPEFQQGDREVVYYVRALEEPAPIVNGAGLRCRAREGDRCVEVEPCYGDYRTPADDDCLAPAAERAWSSPIYVSRR